MKTYIVIKTSSGTLALRQQPEMEMPKLKMVSETRDMPFADRYYEAQVYEYEQHLASIETIDIAPEYKERWKVGDLVKKGEFEIIEKCYVDFPVIGKHDCMSDLDTNTCECEVAIPKAKEQEKESDSEFLKILANRLLKYDEENIAAHDAGEYDKYNWQISGRIQELKFVIGQLKLHYHITKK